MFEIVRTQPGDSNFQLFADFPKDIYPADSLALKIPESFNEEYLEGGYLLLVNGRVQCRAALYNNPHLYYEGKKAFCVGNFEAIDDQDSATALLNHIAIQASKAGAQYLIGPMNGSTWDNYRFSLHHQYPHFFLEPYHHLYYSNLFINSGFEVIAHYHSAIETDINFNTPAVLQREQQLIEAGVKFREINLDEFDAELERVFAFNETAFKSNLFYTPISHGDFMRKYAQTRRFIDPRFVILADDADGNLIGYFFCIDDLYNQTTKTLIAKTVARHPAKQWAGVGHVLGAVIARRALADGYQAIIHAFMYDGGTSVNMSGNFGAEPYKNYVLLGKNLD